VLVAYGWRGQSILTPFHFLGRHLGGFHSSLYPYSTVVLAGLLLHAAWIVAWCVAFWLLAASARGVVRLALIGVTGTLALLFSMNLIGSPVQSSGLGGARWIFLHIVFALALHLGTRIAPVGR
jgi:hypothetical protein